MAARQINKRREGPALCLLWEALDRESKRLEPMNAWYAAAERELKAARAAAGEPVEL
jgi:hypothetical protein